MKNLRFRLSNRSEELENLSFRRGAAAFRSKRSAKLENHESRSFSRGLLGELTGNYPLAEVGGSVTCIFAIFNQPNQNARILSIARGGMQIDFYAIKMALAALSAEQLEMAIFVGRR